MKMFCVHGPTASGKTKFAVKLAQRFGGEIISADSRQVYRGMDIGTGKDLCEYGDVPVHLTDIVPAGTKYDIHHYQQDFSKAYNGILSRGHLPILCGGSGLYIESVTRGYSIPRVDTDPEFRRRCEELTDREMISRLGELKHLHNSTDFDTRKRLIRALEIAEWQAAHPEEQAAYNASLPSFEEGDIKYIGLSVSREERNRRIDERLDARLKEGLVEEVQSLLGSGIPPQDLIYYGLEYKFVTRYLIGEISYEWMREHLAIAIHQFAKRQMTWFRGMERRGIPIQWVCPDYDVSLL